MPELPEVESIAQRLCEGTETIPLPGRKIKHVSLYWPRHIVQPSVSTFRRRMKDRVIRDVRRRGKFLVFPLDEGNLLIHLRMSGDLTICPAKKPRGSYEHTIFHLDEPWQLRFSDARKFGLIYYLKDPGRVLNRLGPEPLDPAFTAHLLAERLKKHQRMLKPLLLDQRFLAGLGNIYTDEALHYAGLHPRIRSDSLSQDQVEKLWHGIQTTLREGLRQNGASIDWVYRGGSFQNQFRVYQRTGEPCPICSTPIERIIVGQRGTHICPHCQPEITK
ncbi:MAG: DNA-formamidopyrimidine glycosylase [Chloroflexi bacterium RBG_16_48_8]|nr:MAG: DNA-formamidopyrimidine glycosylase [Chloroflexi bacterium RBG_16_48_8]